MNVLKHSKYEKYLQNYIASVRSQELNLSFDCFFLGGYIILNNYENKNKR